MDGTSIRAAKVTCSPNPDPPVMRVPMDPGRVRRLSEIKRARHTPEQIVTELHATDAALAAGGTSAVVPWASASRPSTAGGTSTAG